MRIERIRIDAFGPLTGLDTGPTSLGPLVIVLGPNEAGKSTLFSFLTTALYGFQPASRERNPHVPWGSVEAGGTIWIRLEDGCVEVERRLRSAPSGKLTMDGRTRELRNQPLPWVEHVPRAVFRQVFAVTLADLAGLDEETWARIQDRVLGSMGADDLRSARSVAETLEDEANAVWRPSRRGKQRLREVQEEIRTLRARRSGALERDREIRARIEERENVHVRMGEMRAERQRDRIAVERMQELLPLKKQLDRVEALRAEGGPRDQLAGLPADPKTRVADLEAEGDRVRKRLRSVERALIGPQEERARFDDQASDLLAHREQITRFLTHNATVEADRLRVAELRNEVAELDVRVKTAADHLLAEPCDEGMCDTIVAVSIDLLRDRVKRIDQLHRANTGSDRDAGSREGQAAAIAAWAPSALLGGLGLALLSWGLSGGPTLSATIGAALLAAGSTLVFLRLRSRISTGERVDHDDVEARTRALELEISGLLTGVPIRPDYMAPAGDPLVAGLERMQGLVNEWRECARAVAVSARRIAAANAEAVQVANTLGRVAESDAHDLSLELAREVREAERSRDAAQSAEREHARLSRERDAVADEVKEVEGRLSELRERVGRVGDGSDAAGLDLAQRRMEAHARADQIEDELDRAHPDLAQMKSRIRTSEDVGASWTVDEEDLAERRARIEEFDIHIEELIARSEALDRDAAHLREMETTDAVDSEIASLQETEAHLVTERDRKWVMAQLVRDADRRFRDEHQPDLLRRASAFLEHLTGGRYNRLLVDEARGGNIFQLVGPGIPAPIPLARPISTGTLEQAYLSLRLAIVDHLDHGNEHLPLFIDEAFVNWDVERRDRGLEVLADLSANRQVFAFTCHQEIAHQLEARGGRILRLERDS